MKYKIDNYIVDAKSPLQAMKAVNAVKDVQAKNVKDSRYYWPDVRQMCIKNDWYTDGSTAEYNELASHINIGDWDDDKIAANIVSHSVGVWLDEVKRELRKLHKINDSVKDYATPYVVYVKVDGQWKAYKGSYSEKVDEDEFLKAGYEAVKVVKNGSSPDDAIQDDANALEATKVNDLAAQIVSAANRADYQVCGNLCFNLIQYLKQHNLAK